MRIYQINFTSVSLTAREQKPLTDVQTNSHLKILTVTGYNLPKHRAHMTVGLRNVYKSKNDLPVLSGPMENTHVTTNVSWETYGPFVYSILEKFPKGAFKTQVN